MNFLETRVTNLTDQMANLTMSLMPDMVGE